MTAHARSATAPIAPSPIGESVPRRDGRDKVAEVNTMRNGVAWSDARPTTPDMWVGLFDTMRRGVNWQSTPLAVAAAAQRAGGTSEPAATSTPQPIPRVCRPGRN